MEFYKSRNFDRKKSGGNARRNEKLSRSFRNSRNDRDSRYSRNVNQNESAIVTCADCGNECEIPFVPKHDRPVYCSDCFKLNKPGKLDDDKNSRNDRDSRYSRNVNQNESAIVTCADCGNECEIPFVPKHDRPVYCSDCFKLNKPGKLDDDKNSRNDRDSRFDSSPQSNKNNFKESRSKKAKFLKKQETFYSGGSEKFYASLKEKLFEILGGKVCSSCGFKDARALGFCHIYDDTVFDNIRRGGFASSWGKYISEPNLAKEELKVLCLNCNEIRQPISKPNKENSAPKQKKSKFFPR